MAYIKLPGSKGYYAAIKTAEQAKAAEEITINTAQIGLRTAKSDDNKYGWQIVEAIPYDEPCVLCLGGSGVNSDQAANGNAKIIEQDILAQIGVNVPVYSVKYRIKQNGDGDERNNAFVKHRVKQKNKLSDDEENRANSQYLDKLYKMVLEPRISLLHGKEKLSVQEACRRMRMITFVALPQLKELMQGGSAEHDAALNKIFPKMVENALILRREVYQYALAQRDKGKNK